MRTSVDAVMRQIASGKISRGHAAKKLDVSERHVNRLMRVAGVRRPSSPNAGKRRNRELSARMGREMKRAAAAAFIAGACDVEQAAEHAHCSVRTMYRWAKKLQKRAGNGQKTRKIARNSSIRAGK